MIYSYTAFKMITSNVLLATTLRLKAKYRFHIAYIVLLTLYKTLYQQELDIFRSFIKIHRFRPVQKVELLNSTTL
jgi:hypothetical protein